MIGSKEIEIQNKIDKVNYLKKKPEKNDDEPKEKKKKVIGIFTPSLQLNKMIQPKMKIFKSNNETVGNSSGNSSLSDIDVLLLPSPNYAHQWEHNKNKRPIVEVKIPQRLTKFLRPHQRDGVIFLYECLLGFKNPEYFGVILADEMGLGKTLQCLVVANTLLKQGPYGEKTIHRVLIVTPSSLINQWKNEINKWLSNSERVFPYVVDVKHKIAQYSKQNHIPFIIVSYEMLTTNPDDFESLNCDLLICDEGHRLKNCNLKAYVALSQLNIKRKIILTGTPIQNDLQEFFYLVDFVNPGILGVYQHYKSQYENPIYKSQAQDATEEIKRLGKIRAEELNGITSKFILQRSQSINKKYLPKKKDYVLMIRPSELQKFLLIKVYSWYETEKELIKDSSHLQVINILKKICNHPSLIRASNKKSPISSYLEKFLPNNSELGPFDSGKLEVLQNFLKEIIPKKEKIVIVSNHTKTLDMIQSLCDFLQYKYLRLDGKTPSSERFSIVKKFELDFPIFLLSAKAGGTGLNLSTASNLILFDNDWNPATDMQAMSRIWRDGQTKDVRIYRFITAGTIEEKIFQRQIFKISLGDCIMNQKNTGGNENMQTSFTDDELKDLFSEIAEVPLCLTHDSLKCDCLGNGKVELSNKDDVTVMDDDEDPYGIDLANFAQKKESINKNVNELMYWEHHKRPINEDILKDASILNSANHIQFIFLNQTEL